MLSTRQKTRSRGCKLGVVDLSMVGLALLLCTPAASAAPAFEYEPVPVGDIVSATFAMDAAALVAHRTVVGEEVNWLKLLNLTGGQAEYDMSDDLFGTAVWPAPADLDMGVLETGWLTAVIDASYYPALAGGRIGLWGVVTDTDDALFAMDFMSLIIQTTTDTIESYYGWPVGAENDGFGIGLLDGEDLPDVLPASITVGATGTGFDETISSKSIYIPEPTSLALLVGGVFGLLACCPARGQR